MSTAPSITPPAGPRSIERPADAGTSLLGVYGRPPAARVDSAGAIQLLNQSWSLEFWIQTEDRWHTPSTEAAVRQRRLGAGPVIETAVRVSGGDVVHRCWASPRGGETAVIIQLENTTKVPVAIALAVRPFGLDGTPTPPTPGAQPVLAEDHLRVGARTIWFSAPRRDEIEPAIAVIPLPHTATLDLLITNGDQPGSPSISEVPDLATATAGWDSLITGRTRVSLPDDRLTELFDQTRGRLALSTHDLTSRIMALEPGAGNELKALALGGFETEAVEVLGAIVADDWLPRVRRRYQPETLAAIADGIAWAAAIHRPTIAEALLEPVSQLTQLTERRKVLSSTTQAEQALARVAMAARYSQASGWDAQFGLGQSADPAIPDSLAAVTRLTQSASESASWGDDDVIAAANALCGLRAALVRETLIEEASGDAPEVDLFVEWPSPWRGGGAELHELPTVFGPVSAAIRWHGYRPALLWQFDRADHITRPVSLRCSALDPDWSTTDVNGETLLAGTAEGLAQAPTEGESFS